MARCCATFDLPDGIIVTPCNVLVSFVVLSFPQVDRDCNFIVYFNLSCGMGQPTTVANVHIGVQSTLLVLKADTNLPCVSPVVIIGAAVGLSAAIAVVLVLSRRIRARKTTGLRVVREIFLASFDFAVEGHASLSECRPFFYHGWICC
jgi:hypothetical protein